MNSYILIVLVFSTANVCAQKLNDSVNDRHLIRSFNNSLSITVSNGAEGYVHYNDYGGVMQQNATIGVDYLFGGQEYCGVLNLYFYPYRVYSPSVGRFSQPDPKSQYFSSYSFLGGDPVNLIDYDGNEGKPLVLYEENHDFPADSHFNGSVLDLRETEVDAHFVPMSDFMNGAVGDLPEWNGNVFIMGHMDDRASPVVEVETADYEGDFKTKIPEHNIETNAEGRMRVTVRPQRFGEQLRELSEENKVPVKNITVAACEGEETAQGIGFGFSKGAANVSGNKVKVFGLKKGKVSALFGKHTTSIHGKVEGTSEAQYHVMPKSAAMVDDVKPIGNGKFQNQGVLYKRGGKELPLRYVSQDRFDDLLNGRIPDNLASEFRQFTFRY